MKLTKKDVIATALVAAIVVPYVGYLVRGSMPFIQDARGMAGTGLVLLVAWGVVVRAPFGSGAWAWVAGGIGLVALGLGIAALWIESEALLVPFIGAIAILWALQLLLHSGLLRDRASSGSTPSHA